MSVRVRSGKHSVLGISSPGVFVTGTWLRLLSPTWLERPKGKRWYHQNLRLWKGARMELVRGAWSSSSYMLLLVEGGQWYQEPMRECPLPTSLTPNLSVSPISRTWPELARGPRRYCLQTPAPGSQSLGAEYKVPN